MKSKISTITKIVAGTAGIVAATGCSEELLLNEVNKHKGMLNWVF
jgi:hypothetical protein